MNFREAPAVMIVMAYSSTRGLELLANETKAPETDDCRPRRGDLMITRQRVPEAFPFVALPELSSRADGFECYHVSMMLDYRDDGAHEFRCVLQKARGLSNVLWCTCLGVGGFLCEEEASRSILLDSEWLPAATLKEVADVRTARGTPRLTEVPRSAVARDTAAYAFLSRDLWDNPKSIHGLDSFRLLSELDAVIKAYYPGYLLGQRLSSHPDSAPFRHLLTGAFQLLWAVGLLADRLAQSKHSHTSIFLLLHRAAIPSIPAIGDYLRNPPHYLAQMLANSIVSRDISGGRGRLVVDLAAELDRIWRVLSPDAGPLHEPVAHNYCFPSDVASAIISEMRSGAALERAMHAMRDEVAGGGESPRVYPVSQGNDCIDLIRPYVAESDARHVLDTLVLVLGQLERTIDQANRSIDALDSDIAGIAVAQG